MRTKLKKSLQMILSTLIVTIIGIIIVTNLSNNDIMAYSNGERCSICLATTLKFAYNSKIHGYYCDYCKDWYGEEGHNLKTKEHIKTEFFKTHKTYYTCTECNYKVQKTESCTLINFKRINENQHEAQCKQCRDIYILPHTDKDKNGKCDECYAKISQNTPDNHICLEHSDEKIVIFDNSYHDYYAICRLCEKPVLDWQKREPHKFGKYNSKGKEEHSTKCTICDYEKIEEHKGATHSNGGKCIICGEKYEIHEPSDIVKEYLKTEVTHTPVYKCTHFGCEITYEGKNQPHENKNYIDNKDGTHSSSCTKCNKITKENHNFKNVICINCKAKEPVITIESAKYKVLNAYLIDIQPHTEVNKFKQNIQTNATEINIYNSENKLLNNSEIVATGMKLELKNEEQIKSFTLIVNGDVNEDGEADFKDIIKINQIRLNKTSVEKINLVAADVVLDKVIDIKDIVKINQFRLNKISNL